MDVRTGFFALLVAGLGVVGFLMVDPFLQYVLAAALLAFLLSPLHNRLTLRIGPRSSAVVLTTVAFVGAIVPLLVLSFVILRTVMSFVNGLEEDDVAEGIETVRTVLVDDVGVDRAHVDELEAILLEELEGVLYTSIETVLREAIGLANRTIHMSLGLMVLVFLLYYFLLDGRRFLEWIRGVTPLEDDVVDELFEEMSVVTWAVIQSHLLVAIVEGILGGIGLYVVGISNVAFWTVVMIVASVMPIVGVWLIWAPAVGYLLVTGDVLSALFLFGYGITILSMVDNYLRVIFVDKGSGLHRGVVLIGVVGGIYLLGILGLFLGPILLAMFKASVTVFSRTQNPFDS